MGLHKFIKRTKKYADVGICNELFKNNVIPDTELVFLEIVYHKDSKYTDKKLIAKPSEMEKFRNLSKRGEYKINFVCPVYTIDYANRCLEIVDNYNDYKKDNENLNFLNSRKWVLLKSKYDKISREGIKEEYFQKYNISE